MNIKRLWPALLLTLASFVATSAHAALSCNISAVDNFSASYDGLLGSDLLSSGTFTVTCTRTASSDPTSVGLKIRNDDGAYNVGATNRARLGGSGNYLNYDLYTDPAYTLNWRASNSRDIDGTLTLGSGVPTTQSMVFTFYSKIPKGQTGKPQGTYTDTVKLTLVYGSKTAPTVSMFVAISNVPTCAFSTPPGDVAFNYTSFSAAAATASSTFAALCSTNLPYTIALDSTSGVVAGLRYTLSLSSSANTGTGMAQTHTISGNMQAGQAGACATGTCNGSSPHSVTITY